MFLNTYCIRSRNINLMYISHTIGGMMFFLPIYALYLEQNLFTMTNVALIISIEAITAAVFEIPTGAIADIFGRKKTLISAYLLSLISLMFLYLGGNMLMFVSYAILNSFGRSLASGTDSALIYDTLKEENKERYFKKINGTYFALWPLGAATGSIIGGHLATISLNLPVLMTSIPFTIALILILFINEPHYDKDSNKNIFVHMKKTSRLILHNRQLLIIMAGVLMLIALGDAMFVLNPIYFEFKNIPIIYFGYISALAFFLSSAGHYFAHTISERLGDKNTLLLCTIIVPIVVLLSTSQVGILAGILFVVGSFFFGLRNPVIHHLLNVEVTSRNRATVMSASNFMGQVGFAMFAPILGYLADLYTINTAFVISALMLFAVPVLFMFLREKE